jgi:serine/threonine protein kinase
MYGARLSELWGVSEAIQQFFVFEQKLALALSTEPVFLAREQSSGMRMWVKVSDGTDESLKRLAKEADILRSLNHAHILGLKIDKRDFEVPFIGFPWQAEQPLAELDPDAMSGPDRIRMSLCLLEIIDYMQSLDDPVAHCRINTENLWISPTTGWMRLACFGHAMLSPQENDLLADREQALGLISDLLGRGPDGEELKDMLLEAGLHWAEKRQHDLGELTGMLRKRFLTSITADLQAIT